MSTSYASIIQELPRELQFSMLKLVEALQKDMRDQVFVRRQDFDDLRTIVQELAEAQKRTEQRVEELAEAQKRTEQRVEELAEAQKRTEQRVEELAEAQKRTEQRVEELAEAQKRTEQRVEELTEAQKRTEEAVRQLLEFQARAEKTMARLEARQNKMLGEQLERRYRDRAYSYFGYILRKARAVSLYDLEPVLEEHLSQEEMEDLLLLDVLVHGYPRHHPDAPEVWLAIEVSSVVDRNDVQRAQRRAAILRKAGYCVIPAVAGENVTRGGEDEARNRSVFLMRDGHRQFWEEALAQALSCTCN